MTMANVRSAKFKFCGLNSCMARCLDFSFCSAGAKTATNLFPPSGIFSCLVMEDCAMITVCNPFHPQAKKAEAKAVLLFEYLAW